MFTDITLYYWLTFFGFPTQLKNCVLLEASTNRDQSSSFFHNSLTDILGNKLLSKIQSLATSVLHSFV
jgi:hypothetical protein